MTTVPSVQLFVDRAQAVRPDFQLTPKNAAAVASLCAGLEGTPLAIELAAARVHVLTPAQMLARLQERFELLLSRKRDAAPRHQSLRACLDWSYQLLPPELQRFFARLSVFQGGWTLAAAEAVCGNCGLRIGDCGSGERDQPGRGEPSPSVPPIPNRQSAICNTTALEYLEQLRESSLLLTAEQGPAGEMRFRFLETLREYAAGQLSSEERGEIGRRHAAYYLALAEEAEPQLRGPHQQRWLERLESEHDNLRAALDWCQSPAGEAGWGLRMAAALGRFWRIRGYAIEGLERLRNLLSLTQSEPPTAARAKVQLWAGDLALVRGDLVTARAFKAEALEAGRKLGDKAVIAAALADLMEVPYVEGDYPTARRYSMESLAIRRELGDQWGVAWCLIQLASVAQNAGDLRAARALVEECLAIWREWGDRRGIGLAVSKLGWIAEEQGDYKVARAAVEESLAIWRRLGDPWGLGQALLQAGHLEIGQGDFLPARARLEECLALARQFSHPWFIASSLGGLGAVAAAEGDEEGARALLEESLALGRELGHPAHIAHCLAALARMAQDQNDWPRAADLLGEALALARGAGELKTIAICLDGFGALAAGQEQPERAARLFGATAALRLASGAALPPSAQLAQAAQLAALREALGEAAFAAAWAAGQAMSWQQAVAEALGESEAPPQ